MAKINITSVNDKLLDKYIRHSVWMETTATAGAIRAGKLINQKMYNVAKFEAKWNKTVLEKTVPLDISLNVPSNAVLKQLVLSSTFEGHRMQTWMGGYSRSVQAGIVKQLKVGVATGESLPTIAKRLRKVLGQKSRQAETLARTAVSNIVHDAREATFKANKKLIRKVQWVATLDHRTTLICINLDGKVFNVGEGPRPPAHFNCRSTSVPVVTSWQEFGISDPPAFTRASMNGAVPAKLNYRQWLKRQSKSTQIKVLGKKRQALYASGKGKIDRFVGKDLKPLTLKQLARREGLGRQVAIKGEIKDIRIINSKQILKGPMKSYELEAIEGYQLADYENIVVDAKGYAFALQPFFSKKLLPKLYTGETLQGAYLEKPLKTASFLLAKEVLTFLEEKIATTMRIAHIDTKEAFTGPNAGQVVVALEYIADMPFTVLIRCNVKKYREQLERVFTTFELLYTEAIRQKTALLIVDARYDGMLLFSTKESI